MTANVEMGLMVKIVDPFEGELEEALDIHYALSPFFQGIFIDINPVPVKNAVQLCGMAAGPVRFPLDNMDVGTTSKLLEVLDTNA